MIKTHRVLSGVLLLITGLFLSVLLIASTPATAEMEKLEEDEMSTVSGHGGLGVRIDLDFGSLGDDSQGLEIADSDDGGWLQLKEIFGTFSPLNSGDNTIHIDANPNAIQFSAPNQFSGIDIVIDEIGVGGSSGVSPDNLGSMTLADDDGDGDSNYTDGTANFDLHNTQLKIF